jgi:hypothetical protein
MEQPSQALIDAENGLILQLHRVAMAQQRMTKALAVGWSDSEIRGASADLIAAGNEVERIRVRLNQAKA